MVFISCVLLVDISVALAAAGIIDPKSVPKPISSDAVDFQAMSFLIDLGDLTVG